MPARETPEYLKLVEGDDPSVAGPAAAGFGGGYGGGSGMEARIAKLEASVGHLERDVQEIRLDVREIRTDVRDVRERVSKLEERVSHLPGKGFVVTSVLVTLAVMTALIVFQGQVQQFVGQTQNSMASAPLATEPE